MPSGYSPRDTGKSPAYAGRDADLSALSPATDRAYSAEGGGCSGRNRDARPVRKRRADEGHARPLAFVWLDPGNGNISSFLLVAESGFVREAEGMGRYAPGSRAAPAF